MPPFWAGDQEQYKHLPFTRLLTHKNRFCSHKMQNLFFIYNFQLYVTPLVNNYQIHKPQHIAGGTSPHDRQLWPAGQISRTHICHSRQTVSYCTQIGVGIFLRSTTFCPQSFSLNTFFGWPQSGQAKSSSSASKSPTCS